jgi:hypothetical protein
MRMWVITRIISRLYTFFFQIMVFFNNNNVFPKILGFWMVFGKEDIFLN